MGTDVLFMRICVSRWHISLFYTRAYTWRWCFHEFFVMPQMYVMFLKLQNVFEKKSNFFR